MKLSGKNFQPWADFEMEIEGLTVLVGPSNKGKSSLFRALRGVVRNDIPAEFVRNNQDEPLEVTFEVDGQKVIATRSSKGSTKYDINGKDFKSLGGKIPDEVGKLGFNEVKIGETTIDPIFAEQNKAQFLIDSDRWKTGDLNAVLGAFSSTEKLDAGKKEANLRITQRKSEANTLAGEIREAEERADKLNDLSAKTVVVADIVSSLEKAIRLDEVQVGQLQASIYHRSHLEPLQEILESLTIPDLTGVSTLVQVRSNLEAASDALSVSKFLTKLKSSVEVVDTTWAEVVAKHKASRALSELIGLVESQKQSPAKLVTRFTEIISEVQEEISEAAALSSRIAYLSAAVEAGRRIREYQTQLGEQDTLLQTTEQELEEVRRTLATEEATRMAAVAAKKVNVKPGMCPKCHKPLEHVCQ